MARPKPRYTGLRITREFLSKNPQAPRPAAITLTPMQDADRFRFHFGPYRAQRYKYGQIVPL
jgi:hypothetical protein